MDKQNSECLEAILQQSDHILQSLMLNEDIDLITQQMSERNELIFQLLDALPVAARHAVLPQLLAVREKEGQALMPYRQQLKETQKALKSIDQMKAYVTS